MNEELQIIRKLISSKLEEIDSVAMVAKENFGITIPEGFIDDLLYLRSEEYQKRPMDILVEYGFLLNSVRRSKWILGETTIRLSIDSFLTAQKILLKGIKE